MELTTREAAWERDGDRKAYGTGRAIKHEVVGLPPGEEALIANFGGPNQDGWQVLRIKNGVNGEWTGSYASIAEALKAVSKF